MLDAPRFTVRLHYWCEDSHCPGHKQRIIDWELNALQFYNRRLPHQKLRELVTQKFLDNPFGRRKEPLIFVGNQENPQRRASFTVLGIYYPNREEAEKGAPSFEAASVRPRASQM